MPDPRRKQPVCCFRKKYRLKFMIIRPGITFMVNRRMPDSSFFAILDERIISQERVPAGYFD
jgi:hypothetical protein